MEFVTPMPYGEAISKLGSRSVIGSKLASREWSGVPTALRERAFFSAKVEDLRFLQRTRDLLTDFLSKATESVIGQDGKPTTVLKVGSRAAFVDQARAFAIEAGLGDLVPDEQRGGLQDITSETRLGLIFDVQTLAAYSYGAWKQGMDPDELNEFPAQRFIREMDVTKPRIIHQQNEGVVRLKTDLPFWLGMNSALIGGFGVPWGPWGFNSGMGVEDVDRDEAESQGLLGPNDMVRPVEMDFNARLQAGVSGLDQDLQDRLKEAFGDQIEITNGMAKWRGQEPAPTPRVQPAPPPRPAPAPALPTTPTPAPIPPIPAIPGAKQAPAGPAVSLGVDVKLRGPLRRAATDALEAIDRVHGDGVLPTIPLARDSGSSSNGSFAFAVGPKGNMVPAEIRLSARARAPRMTVAHEMGHFLDLAALGKDGIWGTKSGVLDKVLGSVRNSAAHGRITALLRMARADRAYEHARHFEYLLAPAELWARAYAQFIAQESGDAMMLADLDWWKHSGEDFRQWTTEDFAPIRDAIRELFQEKGWTR